LLKGPHEIICGPSQNITLLTTNKSRFLSNTYRKTFSFACQRYPAALKGDILSLGRMMNIPQPQLTEKAIQQLALILENDFTLQDKYLRIQITGKECDGFTYSVGFDHLHKNDLQITYSALKKNQFLILDSFSAFYLQRFTLDFIQDFEQNREGFTVENHDQHEFQGKFWKKEPEKVPK
jgi:Fe-S cluster assembly iron-binding protein IscA